MKKLIIVSGLPGSGKSTIAEGVAKNLSVPLFSVDPIESAILKSGIQKSFETGLAAYLVAQTLAGEQLQLGTSAIIDAVSGVQPARDMWHQLSEKHNAKLIIIEWVLLDESVHRQRIESRIRNLHGIPEVTWEQVQQRKKDYLPWKEQRLIVDSAEAIEHTLKQVLDYINLEHT